jgi:putative phosphonate metabolism protein
MRGWVVKAVSLWSAIGTLSTGSFPDMPERFAIFYAPAADSPLWLRACQWLMRDATGAEVPGAEIAGIDPSTRLAASESARRYGFHATIKAPMGLAPGRTVGELEAALEAFGGANAPVEMGPIELRLLDGFLALMPSEQSAKLTDFAQKVVEAFEPFREPLSPMDRERRLKAPLTPRQIELLDRFGYPYVMEQFRLHMTLTDRLAPTDRAEIVAAAENWFAPVTEKPVIVDRLVLFHEPAAGAAFVRLKDFPLTGGA